MLLDACREDLCVEDIAAGKEALAAAGVGIPLEGGDDALDVVVGVERQRDRRNASRGEGVSQPQRGRPPAGPRCLHLEDDGREGMVRVHEVAHRGGTFGEGRGRSFEKGFGGQDQAVEGEAGVEAIHVRLPDEADLARAVREPDLHVDVVDEDFWRKRSRSLSGSKAARLSAQIDPHGGETQAGEANPSTDDREHVR